MFLWKKEKKKSFQELSKERMEAFSERFGGRFSYMGVNHIVVRHHKYYVRIGNLAELCCHVVSEKDGIIEVSYDISEFDAVEKFAEPYKDGQ